MSDDDRLPERLRPYVFKPGQSGNPSGRPKGTSVRQTYQYAKWLQEGVPKNIFLVIVTTLAQTAASAEKPRDRIDAATLLFKYLLPPVEQIVKLAGDELSPLTIREIVIERIAQ